MTFKLPKFNLDPPEWKEVQRLRQAGLSEQADAVEAHFKSGEFLPYVEIFNSCVVIKGKKYDRYVSTAEEMERVRAYLANVEEVNNLAGYEIIQQRARTPEFSARDCPQFHLVSWMIEKGLAASGTQIETSLPHQS